MYIALFTVFPLFFMYLVNCRLSYQGNISCIKNFIQNVLCTPTLLYFKKDSVYVRFAVITKHISDVFYTLHFDFTTGNSLLVWMVELGSRCD